MPNQKCHLTAIMFSINVIMLKPEIKLNIRIARLFIGVALLFLGACQEVNPVKPVSFIEFEINNTKVKGKYEDCGWGVSDTFLQFLDCDYNEAYPCISINMDRDCPPGYILYGIPGSDCQNFSYGRSYDHLNGVDSCFISGFESEYYQNNPDEIYPYFYEGINIKFDVTILDSKTIETEDFFTGAKGQRTIYDYKGTFELDGINMFGDTVKIRNGRVERYEIYLYETRSK